MLQSLPPDLDRDRVFLLQVLMLTIFVSELGLLILELLLGHQPEIVYSKTFIVVLTGRNFLLLNVALQSTALIPHGPPILFIVIIIDGIGSLEGLLLGVKFLSSLLSLGWFFVGRHDLYFIIPNTKYI